MKYAIFSDIHGNIHALRAALSDAEANGADKYIFLGDYVNRFPWANEVTNTIRGIKNAVVIRGNGEDYLEEFRGKNPEELTLEQFKPVYWTYNKLSQENFEYLSSLPEKITIADNGEKIHLQHSMNIFYRAQKITPFHSGKLREIVTAPFSRQEYLGLARNAVLTREDVLADMRALPEGVYLFGHNHLQFHMELEGRLFVNPGSCGVALDWDATAAYTLLERNSGAWTVKERRVEYDLTAAAEELHTSGYADYTPVWSEIMKAELMTGKDYFLPFVLHLIETGRQLNKTEYPVNNDVWDIAVKTWDASLI